MMQKESALGG